MRDDLVKLPEVKVAIANATPFCMVKGHYYLSPSELKSLAQWFPLFNQILLLKPQLLVSQPPNGWLPLASNIQVVSLCAGSDGWHRRLVRARQAAKRSLVGVDLLYTRMPNYEGYWVFQVAQRLKIPLLLELHGDWVSSIREEDHQGLFRRMTRWGRGELVDRAIREMAKYASAIVTIGPDLKDKYAPDGTPTLVSTNHLLPMAFYSPREDFRLKDPPLILFVGDFQRRKGLLTLFEALRELKNRGRSFEMVLVGDGPLKDQLWAYAEKERLSDQVVFAGRIPHGPDLFAWFKKSDVFVLPSIAAEGVPRVTHEAMALGCPVIATDIGSVAWQLQGGAGMVVQPGNAEALANAICGVLDNIDLRGSLSEMGYRRSLEYTLERQQTTLAEFVLSSFSAEQFAVRWK
jgi:glycosyltransferase involved in cell wall biosynthesis